MEEVTHQVSLGQHTLCFSTGKKAKQASGSVWVQCGGTVVLVTAQGSKEAKPGIDFVPLTVDYQEKMSAAGRIPGGFFKREGKPRDEETLTSRLIDRSIRPLFVEGWTYETQVIATVFSSDPEHPADTLAVCGASLALMLSDVPFHGPIAGIRVSRREGRWYLNPSFEERNRSDINLFVTCSRDAIVMVEGGANEAPESEIVEGLRLAHESAQPLLQMQEEMARQQGKPKREPVEQAGYQSLLEFLRATVSERLAAAYRIRNKLERYQALDEAKRVALEAVAAHPTLALASEWVSSALEHLKSDWVRRQILDTHQRMDGRSLVDIRPISSEVGLLPRTHGSALFTRGETQALVSVTLGTRQDEQKIDDLLGEHYRSFMLHYNFPPYSVGETKFLRGPGRREIGHGALAERALAALVETSESFPYVVRVMSDILESNGSSSMATVCGGSLALMDAGVPIRRPCAGIAMGLIKEGEDVAILSDILGDEDHLGDMDFKVARTEVGITAIQMDIKINGLSWDLLVQALEQAKGGCLHILKCMESTLTAPRTDLSEFAPRITTFRIKTDRIRDVIGPGGKIIKDIVARTGCQINIEDDGLVQVASNNGESSRQAVKMIMDLTQEAEVGKQYLGCVRKIVEYGAFIEIFPGTEGLVHISELAFNRVDRVEDLLAEGDEVVVKVVGIEKGKVRLSLKQALLDQPPAQDPLPPA